jgi:hypothetical protein
MGLNQNGNARAHVPLRYDIPTSFLSAVVVLGFSVQISIASPKCTKFCKFDVLVDVVPAETPAWLQHFRCPLARRVHHRLHQQTGQWTYATGQIVYKFQRQTKASKQANGKKTNIIVDMNTTKFSVGAN